MILKAVSRVYGPVLSHLIEALSGDYTASGTRFEKQFLFHPGLRGRGREGRIRSDAFSNPSAAAAAVE
jgi:hypothetical protein